MWPRRPPSAAARRAARAPRRTSGRPRACRWRGRRWCRPRYRPGHGPVHRGAVQAGSDAKHLAQGMLTYPRAHAVNTPVGARGEGLLARSGAHPPTAATCGDAGYRPAVQDESDVPHARRSDLVWQVTLFSLAAAATVVLAFALPASTADTSGMRIRD